MEQKENKELTEQTELTEQVEQTDPVEEARRIEFENKLRMTRVIMRVERKRAVLRSVFISVMATVTIILLGLVLFIKFGNPYPIVASLSGNASPLVKLETILNTVMDKHIYELDEETLIDGAINGMLDAVDDPYTFYQTAEEYDETFASKNPSVTGIGVTVNKVSSPDGVLITEIMNGSHALEVGILVNDEIIGVNGVRMTEENKESVLESIPGEEGTTLDLIIRRGTEELNFTVERRTIRVELATSHIYNGSIGYIRLRSFQAAAEEDFEKKLDELLEQNITGLIVDLRGNGGGYKHVAINLVDHFIPKGTIYTSKNNAGVVTSDKSTGNMIDIPFVILVNEYSASASELFAGAVQDYQSGLLIGETTFGKGIVQYTNTLNDGSYFQYTAEEWFTPNGRQIHGVGLVPDVVVELDDETTEYISRNPSLIPSTDYDKQLEEAIKRLS